MLNFKNENIWIIGASSGIGRSLAIELANHGANLILSARRKEELIKIQKQIGTNHLIFDIDVANGKKVKETLDEIIKQKKKIDRIIFMAATYKKPGTDNYDLDFAKQITEVNFLGAINIAYLALPIFEKQKNGQLVFCASAAGYTGMPGGQPYSATKAAIINFAESLYVETPDYIDIKIINPGFVKSRITDKNKFHMPFLLETNEAAKRICKKLNKKNFEIHFPKRFTYIVKSLHILPYKLKLFITSKLSGKA